MELLERVVFLDTETTGLDPKLGHRIIEVAAVEMVGRKVSGKSIHFFVDPERDIDAGATAVHGFTWDDLRGKPKFASIIDALIEFLGDSRVIIHNASFDVGFLDHELARLRLPVVAKHAFWVEDSLGMARQKYPGKRNSLDALCDRLGVDNSQRNLHGALLDARLLADVYLAMTRGQGLLEMTPKQADTQSVVFDASEDQNGVRPNLIAVTISDRSRADHLRILENLSQQSGLPHRWH